MLGKHSLMSRDTVRITHAGMPDPEPEYVTSEGRQLDAVSCGDNGELVSTD